MKNFSIRLAVLVAVGFALPKLACATNFTVSGNDTIAKTLVNGETGTVTSSGDLNVSGNTAAVNASGTVTISNSGKIRQTGTGRAIEAANSTINLTNQSGAIISSAETDAIRPGSSSKIFNFGSISANPANVASPSGSDGIDLRTQRTNIEVENSGLISGRHGIATDGANVGPSSVKVTNFSGGTIQALNGSGLNVDADPSKASATTVTANVINAFGGTIKGGVFSNSTDADGDGIDIDGVLTLNNSGNVLGLGAKGASNAEGVAAGGGNIINTSTGQIIGSSLAVDAPNGDATRGGNGILIDDSNGGNAVAATTVINSGLIQGKSGFGIKTVGTFADTITNNAGGVIRGKNNSLVFQVLQTGAGNDVVNNAGNITHDSGINQVAINLEAGDDTLNITGGSASITGGLDGGVGTDALNFNLGAVANTFAYSGAINAFESVNANSGTTRLAGSATLSTASNALTVNAVATLALGSLANTGKLSLALGSVLANGSLAFRLNGTAAGVSGGYDQLAFSIANSGTFTLGGSSQLAIALGFAPVFGTEFVLVDLLNASASISGQFDGLDEGETFLSGGQNFRISYVGGTGNDLSVTAVPEAGTWASFLGAGLLGWFIRRRKAA